MYWKFPADLVTALVEETFELMTTASVQSVETPTFPFNRCAKQGGVESPWAWNTVIRHTLSLCVDKWFGNGLGSA